MSKAGPWQWVNKHQLVFCELHNIQEKILFKAPKLQLKPTTIVDISVRKSCDNYTAWKVSKYGVFSGRCFSVFGLNTDQKNYVFGCFSRSELLKIHENFKMITYVAYDCNKVIHLRLLILILVITLFNFGSHIC